MALVLSTLLYGSEVRSLLEDFFQRLRCFHNRCARSMCSISIAKLSAASSLPKAFAVCFGHERRKILPNTRRSRPSLKMIPLFVLPFTLFVVLASSNSGDL